MSPRDLQAGHDWATSEFYSPWRILRRLWRHLRRPGAWTSLPYLAAVNAAYYGRTLRWRIRGWNPAGKASADEHLVGARPRIATFSPTTSAVPLADAGLLGGMLSRRAASGEHAVGPENMPTRGYAA